MQPLISVIVPALNEGSVIRRCLASLQQQRLPSDCFEVIVVDNGSTDRTREIARSFGGSLAVTVLERSGVRIAALRNLGAATARGEFLAFLDADCVAPSTGCNRSRIFCARTIFELSARNTASRKTPPGWRRLGMAICGG